MAIQTEPTRIQIPFADSGTKNVIPDTNSTPSASQAASWTDGFPAQCSLPLSAGGIPPARADFNGLFNTMTQSIRYGQEGGVWAWDATVDYGTNRVVLGSDGLLYWSVAQSGPNVGGAQNPTTDASHTYWDTIPVVTPLITDKSNKIATTKWVKNLSSARVYIDPNGDDTKDGLSSSSAVKTFSRAMDIAKALNVFNVYVAPGTYAGDQAINDLRCFITLQGNISISGSLTLNRSNVLVVSSSYTLTVSSLKVYSSIIETSSDIAINNTTSGVSLDVQYSTCVFSKAISITTAVDNTAIAITSSAVSFNEHCSVDVQTISDYIASIGSSYIYFKKLSTSCLSCAGFVFLWSSSSMFCNGTGADASSLTATTVTKTCFEIERNSSLLLSGEMSISATNNRNVITAELCGVFEVGPSAVLTIDGYSSDNVVRCLSNGLVGIQPAATVNGTATGKRYYAAYGGQIYVVGAGANRIPGTAAGSVAATSYGYYG